MVRAVDARRVSSSDPKSVHEGSEAAPPKMLTLYPEVKYDGYKWGMAIDLNSCIGCNACVVACQSENNIPVVGKDQVLRGREMHWIRVDTYYRGAADESRRRTSSRCRACSARTRRAKWSARSAPPSTATKASTTWSTTAASARATARTTVPYKVRRFNFLLYQDCETPSAQAGRNPDVTVRSRGVMEKCTYCVQRINAAKIDAEKGDRPMRDGEIKTACQQACPADAIVFGNLNDPNSRVAKLQAEVRNYALLAS